jgi:hypothetical protein
VTADANLPGAVAGQSIEFKEQGQLDRGGQTDTRMYFDRAVVDAQGYAGLAFVGEGFYPSETVTVSGCASFSGTADASGGFGMSVPWGVTRPPGAYFCTLTGAFSGRIAHGSFLNASNVANQRTLIIPGSRRAAGGTFTALVNKVTPNAAGVLYIDGVAIGPYPADSFGSIRAVLPTPSFNFVHTVEWVDTNTLEAVAATLLVDPPALLSERFDAAPVPALPAGWTTDTAGGGIPWKTTTNTPVDTPRAGAWAQEALTVGLANLYSPPLLLPRTARLRFKNGYFTCGLNNGMVLEISVDGQPYQDVLAAGGAFTEGGYNFTLPETFGNPLGGRQAWTGTSPLPGLGDSIVPYISTAVMLPASAPAKTVQFRWRLGTGTLCLFFNPYGAQIDSVVVEDAFTDALLPGTTLIKAVHVRELRARIDALRSRFGLGGFAWTDSHLAGGDPIRAQHIADLRTALAQAYAAAGRVLPPFTDPALSAGLAVKAAHITEIRAALVVLEW